MDSQRTHQQLQLRHDHEKSADIELQARELAVEDRLESLSWSSVLSNSRWKQRKELVSGQERLGTSSSVSSSLTSVVQSRQRYGSQVHSSASSTSSSVPSPITLASADPRAFYFHSLLRFIFLLFCFLPALTDYFLVPKNAHFLVANANAFSGQSQSHASAAEHRLHSPLPHSSKYVHKSSSSSSFAPLSLEQTHSALNSSYRLEMRENIRQMFIHAFDNYMKYAFPHDELKPLSFSWTDSLSELGNSHQHKHEDYQGVALTLIDSLSTLVIMNNASMFLKAVQMIEKHVSFRVNVRVNLFEANIRLLGGLLSAHALLLDPALHLYQSSPSVYRYNNSLLLLAQSLADRMLPAFQSSSSGLPSAWINFLTGVMPNETEDQCTAGVGTLVLEFGLLSYFTKNATYFHAADLAMRKLFQMRSSLNLFGNTLNISSSSWTSTLAGIGAGVDSYYEYLLKAAILFDSSEYWSMFHTSYAAIMKHLRYGHWFIEADMNTAQAIHLQFQSLQAFFPGLQTLVGDIRNASLTYNNFFSVWHRYQALPERYLIQQQQVHSSERYYPLRPELMESTYYLYRTTHHPFYQHVGIYIYHSLQEHSWVPGGYVSLRDVESKAKEDHMTSFFLAETCKYLYLLFDDKHWLHERAHAITRSVPSTSSSSSASTSTNKQLLPDYLFTTEGHLFPIHRDLQKYFASIKQHDKEVDFSSAIPEQVKDQCDNEMMSVDDPLDATNVFYQAVKHTLQHADWKAQSQFDATTSTCPAADLSFILSPPAIDINVASPSSTSAAPQQIFLQLPTGIDPNSLQMWDPNQLQQLLAQALQQQPLNPSQQIPSSASIASSHLRPQQSSMMNDFLVRTSTGLFVIERISTKEIVEARSLGTLCAEFVDKTSDEEMDARILTPIGAFGYKIDLHAPFTCAGRSSFPTSNSYFGESKPPGVKHQSMTKPSPSSSSSASYSANDASNFTPIPVMQIATTDYSHPMKRQGNLVLSSSRLGCYPLPEGTNYTASIVIIYRGRCTFVEKIGLAEQAGAVGVVIVNSEQNLFLLGTASQEEEPTIAALMMTKHHGDALVNCLKHNTEAPVIATLTRFQDLAEAPSSLEREDEFPSDEEEEDQATVSDLEDEEEVFESVEQMQDVKSKQFVEEHNKIDSSSSSSFAEADASNPSKFNNASTLKLDLGTGKDDLDNHSVFNSTSAHVDANSHKMHLSGDMNLMKLRTLGGFYVQIEQSSPGVFQLRVQV